MLLEDAPLRLLSLHHTGLTNADLRLLLTELTANTDDNATQAYLTCLRLGPAVQWPDDPEHQSSQSVAFDTATMQQLISLIDKLPQLQVLQVWGLDDNQQMCLTEAWRSSKGELCLISTPADSFRITSASRYFLPPFTLPTQATTQTHSMSEMCSPQNGGLNAVIGSLCPCTSRNISRDCCELPTGPELLQ